MRPAVLAGLEKRFGGLRVLTGVSFRVAPAEIVALIGPDGAGARFRRRVMLELTAGPLESCWGWRWRWRRDHMLALDLVLILVVLALPGGLADLLRRARGRRP